MPGALLNGFDLVVVFGGDHDGKEESRRQPGTAANENAWRAKRSPNSLCLSSVFQRCEALVAFCVPRPPDPKAKRGTGIGVSLFYARSVPAACSERKAA
jgi:hypothetical protein